MAFGSVTLVGLLLATLAPQPYENERLRFRIHPPSGWQLMSQGHYAGDPVEFWETDELGPRIQVDAFPFDLEEEAEVAWVQEQLSNALREHFPDFTNIDERRLTHRGYPAIEINATLNSELGYYHVLQRSLFANGRIYVITCASFEVSFLEALPSFRASVESLEVMDRIYAAPVAGSGPLVPPAALVAMSLLLLASAPILRRFSIARLKQDGRWPLNDDGAGTGGSAQPEDRRL